MADMPTLDALAAHRHFSAKCFNDAWDLIEKPDRTEREDRMMVALNQASVYHWLCRPDCDDRRLSVGYWQASRIQALLGHPDEALRHAEIALSHSGALPPFYVGYAHEALARAHALAGRRDVAAEHLRRAQACATAVADADERALLVRDLAGL
jgi:tetratricopeptide (TPR) repeat protein